MREPQATVTALRLRRPQWQQRLRAPLLAAADRLRRAVPAQRRELDATRPHRRMGEQTLDRLRLTGAYVIERALVASGLLPVAPIGGALDDGAPQGVWRVVRELERDPEAVGAPCWSGAWYGVRPAAEVVVRGADLGSGLAGVDNERLRAVVQRVLIDPAVALRPTREGGPLVMARPTFARQMPSDWGSVPTPVLHARGTDGATLAERLLEHWQNLHGNGELGEEIVRELRVLTAPREDGVPALAALWQTEPLVAQLLSCPDVLALTTEDGRTMGDWLAERWAAPESRQGGEGTYPPQRWLQRRAHFLDLAIEALRVHRGGAVATAAVRRIQALVAAAPESAEDAQMLLVATVRGLGEGVQLEPAALAALGAMGSRELRVAVMRRVGRGAAERPAEVRATTAGDGQPAVAAEPPQPAPRRRGR